MINLIKNNGLLGVLGLAYFVIRTKLLFRNARIIRFPFRIRGKNLVKIGNGFTTGFNCRIDAFNFHNHNRKLIEIGDNVQINDNVHIAGVNKIIIENNVLIASKVFITDHNHGNYSGENQDSPISKPNDRKIFSQPVYIRENVWLGEFVCVLPGVEIGEGSIIGAMSVVTKNIPAYCIAVGSPAKVIKKYDFNMKEWRGIIND